MRAKRPHKKNSSVGVKPSGQITRTIPWPKGEERETVNLRFSPDGKLLYFFGDDVTIMETEKFTEVETWPFATPSEGGTEAP